MEKSRRSSSLRLGDALLDLALISRALFPKAGEARVTLSPKALSLMKANADFLVGFAKRHVVYGLNTGFGPMAKHILPEADWVSLQYNLIRSHALGMGEALPPLFVRAIMLVRLNTLLKAHSGIYPETARVLASFLDNGVTPIIPRSGSVGASGDLVQLAHVALAVIGEGNVMHKGIVRGAREVCAEIGCVPLQIRTREGLALMNGTSAMTGIASVVMLGSERALALAVHLSALLYEVSKASSEYISSEIQDARPHAGQGTVARQMRDLLAGSKRVRRAPLPSLGTAGQEVEMQEVQHLYSIRCAPQVLGPILDTLGCARTIVEDEANSVTDNPLIVTGKGVFHGGNFHGDYVSIEMDKVKVALTKLSMLSEKHVGYLMNPRLNGMLPPFLNLGVLGRDLGLQGLQFVATSSTAENQTLSNPMSVHGMSTNNDNQDVVSMGANSALLAHDVLDNAFHVLAIEAVSLVYAVRALGIRSALAPRIRRFHDILMKVIPVRETDGLTSSDLSLIEEHIRAMDISIT
jgi:histidine ammonia-lyase